MNCENFQVSISACLDGEKSVVAGPELFHHLGECSGCRDFFSASITIRRTVRRSAAELPEISVKKITAVKRTQPASGKMFTFPGQGKILMPFRAMAAVLAVTFLLSFLSSWFLLKGRDSLFPKEQEIIYVLQLPELEVRGTADAANHN